MTIVKKALITTLLCFGLVMYAASSGMALEAEKPGGASERLKGYHDWHFYLNLYSWLYALQGDVTARGRTSDVDVRLDDTLKLLDEINLVFMGRFEVSKGPWGFLLDGNFLKLEDSAVREGSIHVPILVPSEIPLQGEIEVTSETSVNEASVSYDVYASSNTVGNMPELILEVLGGARYTYLRTEVEVEVQGPLGIRSFSAGADRSRDWVDPFHGGRVLWRPSEKWLMGFRTDVGGFTVSSDFTFNVNAEVAYRINEWLFVNGGYRALYTDYETGSGNDRFEFDMWLHGPWVGVGIEL